VGDPVPHRGGGVVLPEDRGLGLLRGAHGAGGVAQRLHLGQVLGVAGAGQRRRAGRGEVRGGGARGPGHGGGLGGKGGGRGGGGRGWGGLPVAGGAADGIRRGRRGEPVVSAPGEDVAGDGGAPGEPAPHRLPGAGGVVGELGERGGQLGVEQRLLRRDQRGQRGGGRTGGGGRAGGPRRGRRGPLGGRL